MSKSFRTIVLLGFLVVTMCCCVTLSVFRGQVTAVEADTEAIVAWGYQSSSVRLLIPSAITFETRSEAMTYLLEYKNERFAFKCHNDEEVSDLTYGELLERECDQGIVAVYKN